MEYTVLHTADDQMSAEYNERYMEMFRAGNISTDSPINDPVEVNLCIVFKIICQDGLFTQAIGIDYRCKLPPLNRPTSSKYCTHACTLTLCLLNCLQSMTCLQSLWMLWLQWETRSL